MIRTTTAAVLVLAGTALAQYEITIDVENPVLRPGESTTVTLYAGFDPSLFAMETVGTDFVTSVGSEGWSDPALIPPMIWFDATPGTPSATGYDGILAMQFNFGAIGGPTYADSTNPIAFWQATYTAPVDVTAPLDVDLSTMTTRYDVYATILSRIPESHLADLTEGSATIHVIPAPASASLLALGALAMRRRR